MRQSESFAFVFELFETEQTEGDFELPLTSDQSPASGFYRFSLFGGITIGLPIGTIASSFVVCACARVQTSC